jgi:hypothetical protein
MPATIVDLAYVFVGVKMGVGALKMWNLGYLKKEFPRYEYQKIRWQQSGKTNIPLAMRIVELVQGLANTSFWPYQHLLSVPIPALKLQCLN